MDLRKQLEQLNERLKNAYTAKEQAEGVLVKALDLLSGDGVDDKKIKEATALKNQGVAAKSLAVERIEDIEAEIEKVQKAIDKLEEPIVPAPLPTGDANIDLGGEGDDDGPDALNKSLNFLRYITGDLTTLPMAELAEHKAMNELYGGDYRQVDYDQNAAFSRYLRGKSAMSVGDDSILRKMYWPIHHTADMIQNGTPVEQAKAIMVEGVDILGGYAVPPQRTSQILAEAMGLTAVRRAGGLVVQTSSKMIEWLKITGADGQYPSSLRGAYGSETEQPDEKNWEYGLKQIIVHVYTYKVPISVSLLEDADNIETIFTRLASETLAIDEDISFLVGDGATKARGIMPGQLNANGLTEVNSGAAAALTVEGLKKLRRGILSQYRQMGQFSFVGNNQSGEDIELFQDGNGRFYWDSLNVGGEFMGGKWFESEALPDPAADAFPMILGNFSGYAIVERLGLTIQRYNDSNTGPNVVEFHIRRRMGGDVIEPWKFAVQKCSA